MLGPRNGHVGAPPPHYCTVVGGNYRKIKAIIDEEKLIHTINELKSLKNTINARRIRDFLAPKQDTQTERERPRQ